MYATGMKGSEREPHDYIPGDEAGQMQTDPLCPICGQPARAAIHDGGNGWWIEPVGFVEDTTAYGPFADELDASIEMDERGLSDDRYKIVWREDEPPAVSDRD